MSGYVACLTGSNGSRARVSVGGVTLSAYTHLSTTAEPLCAAVGTDGRPVAEDEFGDPRVWAEPAVAVLRPKGLRARLRW